MLHLRKQHQAVSIGIGEFGKFDHVWNFNDSVFKLNTFLPETLNRLLDVLDFKSDTSRGRDNWLCLREPDKAIFTIRGQPRRYLVRIIKYFETQLLSVEC